MSEFEWVPGRLFVRLYLEAPRWEFNRDRGTEATGTGYLRGFLMRTLIGDLSADVAQCGYFGSKNGHVL